MANVSAVLSALITVDPATQKANPQGIDDVLLQQRKDFLRPSSLLAIVGLSDENDCSIKEYGQFYFAAQQRDPSNPNKNFHLPRARSECATNPNDKCCRSCGQDQSGCPADPNCAGSLDAKTDDVNLRCFDQKRRFGIDFLYPTDRYVTALTQPLVPNRTGELVPNPIFSDLDPSDHDSMVRDPSLVFLTYIVGVPWQDIARQGADGEQAGQRLVLRRRHDHASRRRRRGRRELSGHGEADDALRRRRRAGEQCGGVHLL